LLIYGNGDYKVSTAALNYSLRSSVMSASIHQQTNN